MNTEELSEREQEIIRLAARGLTSPEIADQIDLSTIRVRHLISDILGKTHTRNRVELTLWALRNGIVQLD